MTISLKIEAVYRRASLLHQRATESPVRVDLLEAALSELAFVLEELQTSEEELQQQNQVLSDTRQQVESERQRYQDLFDLAPDGYFVTDQTGTIQEANVAIAQLLDVSPTYLIGKPFAVFIADTDRKEFYAKLDDLNDFSSLIQPKVQNWDVQIHPRHGTPFDAAITLSATREIDGAIVKLRWLLRDITQQKQIKLLLEQINTSLEHQVQERTAQLQQALNFETSLKRITDNVRDSLDEHQILQTVIQELTQVLDIVDCEATFYDLRLGTVLARGSPSDQHAIAAPAQPITTIASEGYRQFLQGRYFQFCELIPTLSSTQMTILMCPIADQHTVIGGLQVFKPSSEIFSDLEIRLVHQVANQCAIAIRQARLYQASQQQVQSLEQLHQLKDNFLSTVSHELRTPLSNMNMAIRMLDLTLKQAVSTEQKQPRIDRYLDILQQECQQEIGLVNDLLDLARLDANVMPLVLTDLDLSAWLPQIIDSFIERIHHHYQQIQVQIPSDLPLLTTDANLLRHIVIELLNNACKYTPPDEAIAVTAHTTEQTLQLSVSNSGVDLPLDELDHLFDKFYRVPSHDPWKCSGTGLGLALVKKQVEQIGGAIAVSNLEGWIRFTLQIPWRRPEPI